MNEALTIWRECHGTPPDIAERFRGRYWVKIKELQLAKVHELVDALHSYNEPIMLRNNSGKTVIIQTRR